MTTFKAYSSTGMFRAIFCGFCCLVGLAMVWKELYLPSDDYPWTVVFLLAWILLTGYGTWQGLGVPRVIEWPVGGAIELRSARGTFKLSPQDVVSVKPMADLLVLKHRHGTHYISRNYDGLSEFITRLRRENPGAEIRGL